MLRMRTFAAAAIVFGLSLEITLAQAPSISPSTTPALSLNNSANSLEHVVELTGQLDQRLLTTVYWCLGTLVTVFLILVGYNWFVNFRIHERDFRELRKEISVRLDAAVDKIEAAAKTATQELKTELRKSTESYVDSKTSGVKSDIDSLRRDVGRLEAADLKREVDSWFSEKVYTNALFRHVQYLHKIRKVGYDWEVQKGLDKMETILKRMISERPSLRPDADQIAELSQLLDLVAKKNPGLVGKLQSLVAQLCGSAATIG
jgi:hypothetical protein